MEDKVVHRFREFINSVIPELPRSRVLVAVSGGVDSMALACLFSNTPISFAFAHCNFQLRGIESDLDMLMTDQYARTLSVPFYCKTFDTRSFCKESKLSVQEGARNLRYAWLHEVADQNDFQFIATAHHLDDSIETTLINLLRGTGVRGLAGIPPVNGKIIRPLLSVSRTEIEEYARKNAIPFRTDASNLSDFYLRNKLRNTIIPSLKETRAGFSETMKDFLDRMRVTADALDLLIESYREKFLQQEKDGVSISLKELAKVRFSRLILYELLKNFGFSPEVSRQMHDGISGQSGKVFYAKTYKAIIDREKIYVLPLLNKQECDSFSIGDGPQDLSIGDTHFHFGIHNPSRPPTFDPQNYTTWFDADKLQFPLLLRKMQSGDSFVPLGMRGRKKLSDLLIDKKIPLHKKERIWVLLSGDTIVWVPGLQMGEYGKITAATVKIFKASMNDEENRRKAQE